jgi:signal transduction histidine kinase
MLDNVRDLMTGTLRPAADADADIAVILEQVWRNARTRDAAGCGELVIPEPGSVVVRGGPDPLRRAMQALVQSALRIGRQTRVEVQRAAAQVELAITHRGRRLEPALAGRLFDPDFTGVQNELGVKIDRARGLWFASCAVQAHEGTLTYEPMGDGGRFVVNLPLSPKASPRP